MSNNNDTTLRNLSFDPFDPARKNGFLVEWRVTPGSSMDKAIASAQAQLLSDHQPKIQVLKSCAAGNFHITLNEFALETPAQLHEVMQFCQKFATVSIPAIVSQLAVTWKISNLPEAMKKCALKLNGISDFKAETFFVALKGDEGVDFLKLVYNEFHRQLYEHFASKSAKNPLASNKPKRDLTAHITIGRAQRGSVGESPNWYEALMSDKKLKSFLSSDNCEPDFGEIVFCSRRHPTNEAQPPLIMKFFPIDEIKRPAAKNENDDE